MGQRRVLNLTVCLIIATLWRVSAFRAAFTAERPKLLVGHQVNLTCRVDCEKMASLLSAGYECNSSYMYIKRNRVIQNTTILNNLTVQFEAIASGKDLNLKSGKHQTFMCYMGHPLYATGTKAKYLASTSIEIYKPMVPEYFDCVTPNWEKAICKWCDEEVYGKSTWEVKYKEGISGNWSSCPDMPGGKGCTCIWSNENGRHDFNRYTMNVSISGKDALGTITTKTFGINFFDNSLIVPNPVDTVQLTSPDSHSMKVKFDGPDKLEGLAKLLYNVTLQSKFDSKNDQLVVDKEKGPFDLVFSDLIPYVKYTAVVKLRPFEGNYWSHTTSNTGRTMTDVPARNPETRPSSFQNHLCGDDCRSISVYYQDIPERYTHGIITGMKAIAVKGSRSERSVKTEQSVMCSFAKDRKCNLSKLPFTSAVSVVLVGATSVGFGPKSRTSWMNIPKYTAGAKVPEYLTGEIQNKTENVAMIIFEWTYDAEETPDNFVLYYRHLLGDVVQGGIQWIVLNGTLNVTELAEVAIDYSGSISDYQFAIAAEKSGQSTGMSKLFQKCLYTMDGAKPIILPLKFDETSQQQKSINVELSPQVCEPGHKQIVQLVVSILEVKENGAMKKGGLNKSMTIGAPRKMIQHIIDDLQDNTFYNISLTAICRDGSYCQHSLGMKLKTNPPLAFVFPAWAIGITVFLILAVLFLIAFGIYRYYKKVTDKTKQVHIRRTPAVTQAKYLGDNPGTDEYYDITLDKKPPRCERSESESSSSDGDHGSNKEMVGLIPNGRSRPLMHPRRLMSHESAGSGHSGMTDVTYLPSESDSDEIYLGGSPRSLNPISQTPDLQPVPESAESNSPTENEYSTINNDPSGEVFVEIADGNPRGRYVLNQPKQGRRVYSRPQNAPAHILPRPEPRSSWEARQESHPNSLPHHNSHISKTKKPTTGHVEFRKSASPLSDKEGATGGESDEDYCKLATNSFPVDQRNMDSEGYLVPDVHDELDKDGYIKPKSSSGESADEQDRRPTRPPVLMLPDHDFGSSSSSSDDSDDDSYAKVSHHEPVLGPGGYVQRNDPSPQGTPTRTFTPIERGPGGYCTISPTVSPQRSNENLSRNAELPILNLSGTNINGMDPLPPFSRPGDLNPITVPPVFVQSPDSSMHPVLINSNSNGLDNVGPRSNIPHIITNGYVQHPDPVVLGQEPLNFPHHVNGCLGIPGEYDSEDDSSTTLSDSGPHSNGAFPSSLQGMPINDGYVQRPDQNQAPVSVPVQDNSHPGYIKNTDSSNVRNHSDQNTVHSRPNCNGSLPNHRPQNGYVAMNGEPPALIRAPQSLNSNNSNSNNSNNLDHVQSGLSEFDDAEDDISLDESNSCATLPVTLECDLSQENSDEDEESTKTDPQSPLEQRTSIIISASTPQSNGYVDSSVLMGTSEPPSGDMETRADDVHSVAEDSCDSSEDEEGKSAVVNQAGYVSNNVMHVC